MTTWIGDDEFDAMGFVVPVVVAALFEFRARVGADHDAAAVALETAAESLLTALDAMAALAWPEQAGPHQCPWHIN